MRPAPADYPTLFDIHPLGTEPPVAQRVITRGCLLPLAANEVVDMNRTAKILGTTHRTIDRLRKMGCITGYNAGSNHSWSISYASIVEFCDRLRIEHHIRDRRPPLKSGRWRDDDLLPFPMSDTIDVSDAMLGLDFDRIRVLNLCEEGAFESYRFCRGTGYPWRISKTSLFAYAEKLKQQVAGKACR